MKPVIVGKTQPIWVPQPHLRSGEVWAASYMAWLLISFNVGVI